MTTYMEIPGSLTAKIVNDKIVGYTFIPHGADAGYFGPAAVHVEGPEIDETLFFDMITDSLQFVGDNAIFICEWES
jgi:hypothetical protein